MSKTSRKWILTLIITVFIGVLSVGAMFLAYFEKEVGFIAPIITVLAAVPSVYIGGNVIQKKSFGGKK